MQVTVGFFFSLLILWYFSYRLLFHLLLQFFDLETSIYITFLLSLGICSLMVKPTIRKEMGKVNEPFSIVAKNPDIDIPQDEFTLKVIFSRSVVSVVLACLLSLPFSLIILFRYVTHSAKETNVFLSLLNEYSGFYLLFFGASFFVVFIFFPSLKKWHWTKYQF